MKANTRVKAGSRPIIEDVLASTENFESTPSRPRLAPKR